MGHGCPMLWLSLLGPASSCSCLPGSTEGAGPRRLTLASCMDPAPLLDWVISGDILTGGVHKAAARAQPVLLAQQQAASSMHRPHQ